jgi:CBS domain containing-hemolysin-like protein
MLGELGLILVAFALVVLNGFFVLAEFAIVKVRATRLEQLAARGDGNARVARDIVGHLDAYLSATQLGITLASLALGWVGEPAFAHLIERIVGVGTFSPVAVHTTAVTFSFLLITFLHILIGELAPKSIAIQHPEAAALFVARPLRWFQRAFGVPLAFMNGASRWVLRVLGVKPASETEVTYTEEEMRSILGASQERGGFSFHHLLLLENAFDFGDLRVADIEVPLDKVAFLDATAPWPQNAAVIAEKRLSRYPLREGPRGKILGFIHVKSVLVDLLAGRTPDLSREVLQLPRVARDVLLEVALRRLQKSGAHMGLVTDAKGADVAIFTLEDLVEELIGDITDEFETAPTSELTELLTPDRILLDPLVKDRHELVEFLVRVAVKGSPDVDIAAALDAVVKREKAVPPSVGGGVAVPHARVPGLKEPRAAFARLRDGIDYQAPDGLPARIVLLILTPVEAAPGTQVRFFQRTASLVQSDYIRERLLTAHSPDEVREIVRIGESSAHA